MLLLSQPGVYDFGKLLFANNFQFLLQVKSSFSGNSPRAILHLGERPFIVWALKWAVIREDWTPESCVASGLY